MRKKVIVGIMSVLLIMMLSACSGDNKVKKQGSSKSISEVGDQRSGVSLSADSSNSKDNDKKSRDMNDLMGDHDNINDSLNGDIQKNYDNAGSSGTVIYSTVDGHGDKATGTLKELLNK